MNKLEKIEIEAQKAREKIAAMQAILKQIDGKRTEQENLQIIQQVRALKLSRDELYGFLNAGELPASLAAAFSGDTAAAPEPEPIYSRRERARRHEPETTTEPEGETITNIESEDMSNENE